MIGVNDSVFVSAAIKCKGIKISNVSISAKLCNGNLYNMRSYL